MTPLRQRMIEDMQPSEGSAVEAIERLMADLAW
jgi:hypothetical protein